MSNLPNGKGFSPLQWQILEGKDDMVIHLTSEEFDSGDIIDQIELKLDGTELMMIRSKQPKLTFNLIERFIKNYPSFKRRSRPVKALFIEEGIPPILN